MSTNCYYIKEPLKKCDGTVTKYTIRVITPPTGKGTCQFNLKDVKTGDIVEEPCSNDECVIAEYNAGNTSFKNAVLCLIKSFTDTFAKDFSSGPGDCSSDKVIKQNFKLVVGPEADLSECSVEVDQKIDATSEKVCANINQTLSNFEGKQRYDFIVALLNKVISSQPDSIKKKPEFVNRFKQMMIDVLMASQGPVNSKCSQSISISQDQNVYLLGNIKCKDSKFKFSQEAILNAYMSCITTPVMDQLTNDPLLKKYYSLSQNADCVYDTETIESCNGSVIKSKVNIITPAKGTGKCVYNANQIITTPCTFGKCKVSSWSEWSPCLSNEIQHRKRTITLQGKDCPNLYEEQKCKYESIRERPNARPETPKRINIYEEANTGFYKFFSEGPSGVEYKNTIITYAFLIFFLLVFIYVIFFL
jgi:hypothetical protein